MYIHIGNKKIISGNKAIGIFNSKSLELSDSNNWILSSISEDDKAVVVLSDNTIVSSNVSPYTILKRTSLKNDFVWRKKHD